MDQVVDSHKKSGTDWDVEPAAPLTKLNIHIFLGLILFITLFL